MSTTQKPQDIADFDALRKAVQEEEQRRPPDINETPMLAQTTYTLPTTYVPRDYADLADFNARLQRSFKLRFDDSEIRDIVQAQGGNVTSQQIMDLLQKRRAVLKFTHGMLHFTNPDRITPIIGLGLSSEAVQASVIGTTAEASWVAQKGLEEMWASAGGNRTWSDLSSAVQLVGYTTTSQVNLGYDLLKLFSPEVQRFFDEHVVKSESLGRCMGRHFPNETAQKAYVKNLQVVPIVHGIECDISLFDPVSGRQETCSLRLDVAAKTERGKGIVTVTSELDSRKHTEFITKLRDTLLTAKANNK